MCSIRSCTLDVDGAGGVWVLAVGLIAWYSPGAGLCCCLISVTRTLASSCLHTGWRRALALPGRAQCNVRRSEKEREVRKRSEKAVKYSAAQVLLSFFNSSCRKGDLEKDARLKYPWVLLRNAGCSLKFHSCCLLCWGGKLVFWYQLDLVLKQLGSNRGMGGVKISRKETGQQGEAAVREEWRGRWRWVVVAGLGAWDEGCFTGG